MEIMEIGMIYRAVPNKENNLNLENVGVFSKTVP